MKKLLCISCSRAEMTVATARAFAATESQLIEAAQFECDMAGSKSLLERAGIATFDWVNPDSKEVAEAWFTRNWRDGEQLATALQVFRESVTFLTFLTFLTFDATDPQDRQLFVLEADARGCGDQARACLEEVSA